MFEPIDQDIEDAEGFEIFIGGKAKFGEFALVGDIVLKERSGLFELSACLGELAKA